MPLTREETIELVHNTFAALDELDPKVRSEILESDGWADIIYDASPELTKRLQEYFEWREKKRKEDPGNLMEEIAYLLFRSIRGTDNIRSFQSYAPQHDLVVDGNSTAWQTLMLYLHLPRDGRTIVVEAKNQVAKIDDHQFSRLCGILQNKFANTSQLGVFISRTKATGFPFKKTTRERSLRDVRATQALFHARTNKYVVVIDEDDLKTIFKGVPFTKILEMKIREIEASSGKTISFDEDWGIVDLPEHLSRYERK